MIKTLITHMTKDRFSILEAAGIVLATNFIVRVFEHQLPFFAFIISLLAAFGFSVLIVMGNFLLRQVVMRQGGGNADMQEQNK